MSACAVLCKICSCFLGLLDDAMLYIKLYEKSSNSMHTGKILH